MTDCELVDRGAACAATNVHCTVGTQERAPSESRVAVAERLNTEAGKLTKILIILIIIKGHLLPSAKRAGARAPVEPYLCTCLLHSLL